MSKLLGLSAIAVMALVGCRKPTIPHAGDPCSATDGLAEYCGDAKTLLKCIDGAFVAHHCSACTQKFDVGLLETTSQLASANCSLVNPTAAKIGSLCDGGSACEEGGKHSLKCVGTKLVAMSTCGGPDGCAYNDDERVVHCDSSVGDLGDICSGETRSCSADGHALLVCKDGHLAVGVDCGPDGACANINHTLGCSGPETASPEKPAKRRK